jgi:branched-chain amino acid transport system ATP-binding protein
MSAPGAGAAATRPAAEAGEALLRVEGLGRRFGGVEAVADVTFSVAPGERLAIIGPNGAGKTTLLNCLSGDPPPTSGRIWLQGKEITGAPPNVRADLGISRSFQSLSLFGGLTVRENAELAVAAKRRQRYSPLRRMDRLPDLEAEATALLDRVGMTEREATPVLELSHGEQRILDLGLTLAGSAELFLFDEPGAGMSAAENETIAGIVDALPATAAMIVIDHDMDLVFRLAQRIIVLDRGHLVAQGTPAEIREDPVVREVYLGGDDDAGSDGDA